MNDIPSRPLRADFTTRTLEQAQRAKRRSQRWHGHQSFVTNSKLFHKPIFALLAVLTVIALGGTAYAAVNGGLSSITALFGGAEQLNDSRIVKVSLQNCHDRNQFNIISGTGNGATPRYYRVKNSANISNARIVSLVQSVCRSSYSPQAEMTLLQQIQERPENKDQLIGNSEGVIVALSSNEIDIQISGDTTSDHKPYVEHFSHLDTNLAVLDGSGQTKTIASLKVGDTVDSSYRSAPNTSYETETTAANDVDWRNQILVYVTKQSPDQAQFDAFTKLTDTHVFEEVVPCKQTKVGYCTFEELP